LEAILEDLTDLDDLDDSVTVVESDPSRYGLSVEEVRRRRGFVEQVKDQVEDLRDSTTRTYNSHQVCPDCLLFSSPGAHLQLVSPKPTYPDGYSTSYGDRNSQDEDFEEFHQQTLMRNQDEQLEGVSYTVGNLQQQAREMGEELDDQVM
jgi:member of the syntaxin family of t-SNAREs